MAVSVLSALTAILNPLVAYKQQKEAYSYNKQQAKTSEEFLKQQEQFVAKQIEDEYNQKLADLQRQQEYLVTKSKLSEDELKNQLAYEYNKAQWQKDYNYANYYTSALQAELEHNKTQSLYSQQEAYLQQKAWNTQQEYAARLQQAQQSLQADVSQLQGRIGELEAQKELSRYENKLAKIATLRTLRHTESQLKAMYGAHGVELAGTPLIQATVATNAATQTIAQQAALLAKRLAVYNAREGIYQGQISSAYGRYGAYADLLGTQLAGQLSSISNAMRNTQINSWYENQYYPIRQSILANRYNYEDTSLANYANYLQQSTYLKGQQIEQGYLYNYNNINTAMNNLYNNLINAVKSMNADYATQMYQMRLKQYIWGVAQQNAMWTTGQSILGGLARL